MAEIFTTGRINEKRVRVGCAGSHFERMFFHSEAAMTPYNLIVILVFSMVIRGAFGAFAGSAFAEHGYAIDLIGQLGFGLLLVILAWRVCGLCKSDASRIFGRFAFGEVLTGSLIGLLSLSFTFGESALTTMFISRHDPALAYTLGHYHDAILPADSFISLNVLSFVLVDVLIVAVIEEMYFRGLLVSAFMKKRTFWRSVVTVSLIFTSLHFQEPIFINTFVFAISLSWLYRLTQSLYPCIAAHFTFNLLAFLSQYYFDFHRVRSIDQLSNISDWIPEMTLLAVSLLAGVVLWARTRNYSSPLKKRLPDKPNLSVRTSA